MSAGGGPVSCEKEIVPLALRAQEAAGDRVRAPYDAVRGAELGRREGKEEDATRPQPELDAPLRGDTGPDDAVHEALHLEPVDGAELSRSALRELDDRRGRRHPLF